MKFDASIPIYLQVVTAIKRDIVTGRMKAGDKLPSGRDLAAAYQINPNTSARVYQELEKEGIIFTKRGLGTFVTEDETLVFRLKDEMAEEVVSRFLEGMNELNIPPGEAMLLIEERLSAEIDETER